MRTCSSLPTLRCVDTHRGCREFEVTPDDSLDRARHSLHGWCHTRGVREWLSRQSRQGLRHQRARAAHACGKSLQHISRLLKGSTGLVQKRGANLVKQAPNLRGELRMAIRWAPLATARTAKMELARLLSILEHAWMTERAVGLGEWELCRSNALMDSGSDTIRMAEGAGLLQASHCCAATPRNPMMMDSWLV